MNVQNIEFVGFDVWAKLPDGRDVYLSNSTPAWVYGGTHPYGDGREDFEIDQQEWVSMWRQVKITNPHGGFIFPETK